MNATTKLLAEDVPGRYLNRHPASTQTFRHGKAKLKWQDRRVPGGDVTVRRVKPAPLPERKFPWHLMG